ncbi:hypothetical protein [Cellulomonas citrea]|uniref:hypothetical protein n=1 Tax=Cellulomonas citrea TaxID=1909423 RepID=UPI001359659D|nr:hypothetical protein [Cellulomonas citrea]
MLILLGGCSADGHPAAGPSSGSAATAAGHGGSQLPEGAEIPAFSGTWAAEFERAYRASTSDLQRQVLRDGRVTDQEMVALQDDFRSCLESQGFTGVTFDDKGGFQFKASDASDDTAVNSQVTACQDNSLGQVSTLFYSMQRNPANEDELEIMAACLVRQGLAPAGYSAEDYGRDAPAGAFPFDSGDPRFGICVSNPLAAAQ